MGDDDTDATTRAPADPADLGALLDDTPIEPSGQLQRWRRGTATGSILGAVALGLREALDTPREEAPIHQDAPGEPPGPRRFDVDLDADDPAASTLTYRPYL